MVGQPQGLWLQEFGDYLHAAFGHVAYHVGSSLANKDGWRDVDVRLMLPDDEWAAMGFGEPGREHYSRKWVALTLAWSAFGRHLTGLPIDFQIQQRSAANTAFPKNRSALFTVSRLLTHEEWEVLERYRAEQASTTEGDRP